MQLNELLKKIGNLSKRIAATVAEIQTLAVECVIHAVEHGNVTPATALIDGCGKGIRRQSLSTWFERNGCHIWDTSSKKFKLNPGMRKYLSGQDMNELRERLMALPWQDAVPEPNIASVLDVSASVDQFLRRLHKQINDGKMEIRNRELLAVLEQTAAVWHAKKVMASIPQADEAEMAAAYPEVVKAPNAPVPDMLHMVTTAQ